MAPTTPMPTLLIADDDLGLRTALREVFEPRGFQTILAENGSHALEILNSHMVDCLLLDVHMPIMTGVETLQIARQRRVQLPCVMITADPNKEVLSEAVSLRAFTVLCKPFKMTVVIRAVKQAMETQKSPENGMIWPFPEQ